MAQTYKGVVFDLDGTLIDSVKEIATATNQILQESGYPTHPVKAYKYFAGQGARILLERAAPPEVRDHAEKFNDLLERFLVLYRHLTGTIARPFDGIPEMLSALTKKGLRLYVLSNKPHDSTRECVETLLSHWNFDMIIGARENIPVKPDPAGAMEILEATGLTGEEMLYLGDTSVDMETAKGAGMVPVGVLWGFREKEELRQSGARYLIAHPMELLGLL